MAIKQADKGNHDFATVHATVANALAPTAQAMILAGATSSSVNGTRMVMVDTGA